MNLIKKWQATGLLDSVGCKKCDTYVAEELDKTARAILKIVEKYDPSEEVTGLVEYMLPAKIHELRFEGKYGKCFCQKIKKIIVNLKEE